MCFLAGNSRLKIKKDERGKNLNYDLESQEGTVEKNMYLERTELKKKAEWQMLMEKDQIPISTSNYLEEMHRFGPQCIYDAKCRFSCYAKHEEPIVWQR